MSPFFKRHFAFNSLENTQKKFSLHIRRPSKSNVFWEIAAAVTKWAYSDKASIKITSRREGATFRAQYCFMGVILEFCTGIQI